MSLPVSFYFHAPGADKIEKGPMQFHTIPQAVASLMKLTDLDQYIAILEHKGEVTRYLVTKDAGILAVIPMECRPGWTKGQAMVSNIVNFVMASEEYPTLPCEDE
jgi:hypothetical protein